MQQCSKLVDVCTFYLFVGVMHQNIRQGKHFIWKSQGKLILQSSSYHVVRLA